STATKVKHCDGFVFLLVETVGQRGRGRLVDDTHHFETRDFAGVFGRLALRVVEVSGNGDDSLINLLAEVIFGRLLHFLQDDCRNLRRTPILASCINSHIAAATGALNLVGNLFDFFADFVVTASHEPFYRINRVRGIRDRLAFGDLAYEAIAVFSEGNDRRGGASTFRVRD